jgi:hypothetical protein
MGKSYLIYFKSEYLYTVSVSYFLLLNQLFNTLTKHLTQQSNIKFNIYKVLIIMQ